GDAGDHGAEAGLGDRAAVAVETHRIQAGHGADRAVRRDLTHHLDGLAVGAGLMNDVHVSGRVRRDPGRTGDLRLGGRAACAVLEPAIAAAGDRGEIAVGVDPVDAVGFAVGHVNAPG